MNDISLFDIGPTDRVFIVFQKDNGYEVASHIAVPDPFADLRAAKIILKHQESAFCANVGQIKELLDLRADCTIPTKTVFRVV